MIALNKNSRTGQKAHISFGGFKVPVVLGVKVIEYNIVKYYCRGTDGVNGQGLVKERDLIFSDVL